MEERTKMGRWGNIVECRIYTSGEPTDKCISPQHTQDIDYQFQSLYQPHNDLRPSKMTDFLNAVGLFAKSNFPGDNGPNGAIISVKAGLAANLTEAGGGIKAVYAYDADNQYLGEGK
ncbi:hypothetical protein CBER1_10192 [Cercospora berteroae]|uniref:Uncharacterized protein n=1 Tax=Cercospora berteroae TaxID=357750 RepID=A0A2S6C6I2_9PEZI|nr:hypothetical protein CBER1_10192 [Cercospora berteroae]